ncbi:MAG: GGDEF domain-containing protein [Acidobacteriota bacterium]
MSDGLQEKLSDEVIRSIGEDSAHLGDWQLWTELLGSILRTAPSAGEVSSLATRLGSMMARGSPQVDKLLEEFSLARSLIHQAAARLISEQTGERYQLLVEAQTELDHSLSVAISAYLQVRIGEAQRDPITALPNRTGFEESLKEEIERAERYHRHFALAVFDIDHFKSINDRLGHPEGDRMLAEVASVLTRSLRRTDQVFRYGGDEFAAICLEMAEGSMESVLRRVEGALEGVTISSGVAYFPIEASDGAELVKLADKRLYECKRTHHGLSS